MKKSGLVAFALMLCLLTPLSLAAPAEMPSVGSIITFGNYEQDNDLTNGKEPIEWIVLEVEGDQAFLISKLCLDVRQYYHRRVSMYWAKSPLRAWMNEDFLNAAFTAEEQAAILTTTVSNEDRHGRSGARVDTLDKIYLLSRSECLAYFPEQESRIAYATEYAKAQGCALSETTGATRWWLRTPGMRVMDVFGIRFDGRVNQYGCQDVDWKTNTIRPVMWVRFGE